LGKTVIPSNTALEWEILEVSIQANICITNCNKLQTENTYFSHAQNFHELCEKDKIVKLNTDQILACLSLEIHRHRIAIPIAIVNSKHNNVYPLVAEEGKDFWSSRPDKENNT